MAQHIIIAEPSYLMKRGISAVISDIVQAEVIFMDELQELNNYLETNPVDLVFIDEQLLSNKTQRDLFFQLQSEARYIVLTNDRQEIPARKKFTEVISRNAPKEKLIPLLEKVLGDSSVENRKKSAILSERENEVLKQVALGYTNQQIADRLFISKHTVISHRKNITSKLGIKTVSGLTVYAVLNNLIPKDQIE
ncbi:MAG: response regulator transcription factor [Bacteroidales bacterium]|nr:response regulator transcription factor [Bacteroidales bacterium]